MQDEINLLKEKVNYLNDGNRRLHASCEKRNQDLQDKLDTCENQNGAIYDLQSNNQICERKVEGIDRKTFESSENINLNLIITRWFYFDIY